MNPNPASRFPCLKVLVLAALAVFACVASPAFGGGVEFVVNGIRLNGAIVPGLPLPVGADAEIHMPLTKSGLFFSLRAAGGYEDRLILRDDTTGAPLPKPANPGTGHWFMFPNAEVDAGLSLRFTDREPDRSGVRTEIFALGRFRWESNINSLGTTLFPDANGLMSLSAIAGLAASSTFTDAARMKSGYSGEVSFEYAPSFTGIYGGTDFIRANIKTLGYLPLASLGKADPRKNISVYTAWMATVDYAAGNKMPLYVLTTFGGRALRDGIGKSVRGYQNWGYESPLKAAMSAEIRAVGPAIFGVPSLRPMLYAFGDCGIYSGLSRAGSLSDSAGFVFSTGAGANIGILDFAYLGARAGYKFPMKDDLYTEYFPDGRRFFWDITFLLHF